MPTVTVPGGNSGSPQVTFTFNAGNGLTVAQQISNALALAVTNSTLSVTGSTGGIIPPPVGSDTQELLLTGPITGSTPTVPAGYGYVVNDQTLASTITAAPGTVILTGLFGSLGGLFQASGAATIVAASGNNVISQSGAGAIVLAGGSGNDTITAAGTGSVFSGAGSDVINVTGGGEYVQLLGADTVNVTAASGTDTIDFSTDVVHGSVLSLTGGANLVLYGAPLGTGSQTPTIQASGGADTAFGSGAGGALYNASGSSAFEFVSATGQTNTIMGGASQETLFGGAGGNLVYSTTATNGGALFVAGSGNETLNASGSSSPVTAWGGTGADSLVGGAGSDILTAGSGSVTMTGGGGANDFNVIASRGPASITITDMNSSDFVQIFGYGAANEATNQTALNAATGSSFSLTDGTTITFLNTTVSAVKSNISLVS
jgi:Ca2+-binding RTX toxin-like protein